MKVTKTNLHKFFASLNDAQIICLAAELEQNPEHVAKRMNEFISGWGEEKRKESAKEAIRLFSDLL